MVHSLMDRGLGHGNSLMDSVLVSHGITGMGVWAVHGWVWFKYLPFDSV
jgi:hypothetical protein